MKALPENQRSRVLASPEEICTTHKKVNLRIVAD